MNAVPEDVDKQSSSTKDCDGAAHDIAETLRDNLAGQLTILKSQLQELAISFGEVMMPAIRKIVSAIHALIDKLNRMDDRTMAISTFSRLAWFWISGLRKGMIL